MTSHHPLVELFIWVKNVLLNLTPEKIEDYVLHGPEYYYKWWMNLLRENPNHVIIETILFSFIIWLLFIRKTIDPTKESKTKLTQKEIDWLVETWEPEPLVPVCEEEVIPLPILESTSGNYMTLRGQKEEVLNLASSDFLGLSKLESFKEKAKNALDKYGCGACGPRGFYGTIDVHLEFEKMLAEFMGTEEAICYSDGASAVSSCIPAYSKRGDLLVVDEGVGEPIRTGVNLSRSTVHYFKHNDMEDLNRVLKKIVDNDKKYKRNALQQRRFIVVEGLYRLSGDLCPLPDIIKLKDQFCFRLMLDESLSFGTVGNTGRGVTEHFGVAMKNIDMCLVSMDTTLGSIGGGCVGTNEVVDHQRLSGSGYCFSASCPPFLFAAAVDALEHLKSDGPDLLIKMRGNVKALTAGVATIPHVKVISDPESPVFHVALDTQKGLTYDEELVIAKNIADKCVKNGVGLIAVSHDFKLLKDIKTTSKSFRATLRVNVTANLTSNEINKIVKELKGAVKEFV